MPCYDPTNYENEATLKRLAEVSSLLCQLCQHNDLNLWSIPDDVFAWWQEHKVMDAKRKEKK